MTLPLTSFQALVAADPTSAERVAPTGLFLKGTNDTNFYAVEIDPATGLIPTSGGGGGGGGSVTQGTVPWVTDGSAVVQPISATSLPLPTGAASAANQSTANTSLSTIATNTTGAATAANQNTASASLATIATNTGNIPSVGQKAMAASLPVVIASDQSAVLVSGTVTATQTALVTGTVANSTSVSSGAATTFSAPANAIGFILQAESGNTANVRWAIGSAATSTVGMLAEPGRDTGYLPLAANISVIAISGTQSVAIQWVSR